jgi:penicillin-binding protein 2
MAVMTAAFANGGVVLWPRLVARIEPQDPLAEEAPVEFPARRVRDHLGVAPRHLATLRQAMLADTEDPEGTAHGAFRDSYRQPGAMRVCGKTGTAQVTDARNRVIGRHLWFIAFAPHDSPRYAVVVLVEGSGSGGATAAPVARDVFEALHQIEASPTPEALLTRNP